MSTFVRDFFEMKYFRGGQNVIILRINNFVNKERQKIIVVKEKDLLISILYSTDLYSTTYKILQNITSQEL